jgi:hypothetical protein
MHATKKYKEIVYKRNIYYILTLPSFNLVCLFYLVLFPMYFLYPRDPSRLLLCSLPRVRANRCQQCTCSSQRKCVSTSILHPTSTCSILLFFRYPEDKNNVINLSVSFFILFRNTRSLLICLTAQIGRSSSHR